MGGGVWQAKGKAFQTQSYHSTFQSKAGSVPKGLKSRSATKPLCWLVLCQTDTSLSHLGRENLNWESVPTRLACG